jgi:transposase
MHIYRRGSVLAFGAREYPQVAHDLAHPLAPLQGIAEDIFRHCHAPCNLASQSGLKTLFADSGYQGPKFAKALAKVLPHLDIEIVKRSGLVSGFVVLPKRWIVERTIAWLNRCRRLAKDWECLNRKALAFLRLASIRLMLRKLCNPA